METVNAPSAIDQLLALPPFASDEKAKKRLFSEAMKEAFRHHMEHNDVFRNYCTKRGFSADKPPSQLSEYPYLPVAIFKERRLSSVPAQEIKAVLTSSATTGTPSTVPIDTLTSKRQMLASTKVMIDYLGEKRRPFLILDEDPSQSRSVEISARSAATRGFLMLASSANYFLRHREGSLHLDIESFRSALKEHINARKEICIFGFTYLLYVHVIQALKERRESFRLPKACKVVHIGGWKKLESQKVTKEVFLKDAESALGIPPENVFDFYGFTEQMGLVYANGGSLPKTVPLYAELIVRDFQTLEPVADGKPGLIQILTPLPHSYPGISVLTEDVGKIVGRGKDGEGRWGTQFEMIGRAKKAEARGCGDILAEIVT